MLTAILLAISCVALGCVVVALLGADNIINWFRGFFTNRNRIKNPSEIAFTLKEKLSNGNVKIVQGVFCQKTDQIEDGIQYEAEQLDKDLEAIHEDEDLVIYE